MASPTPKNRMCARGICARLLGLCLLASLASGCPGFDVGPPGEGPQQAAASSSGTATAAQELAGWDICYCLVQGDGNCLLLRCLYTVGYCDYYLRDGQFDWNLRSCWTDWTIGW